MSIERLAAGGRGSTTLLRGVTEEHGSYNKHAAIQAAGGALALPLLEKAARNLVMDPDDGPIVIADYGSSQGKNSLAPMNAAIATLRRRTSARQPICVVHVDVAENDFSTLFNVLDSAPDSYLSGDPDVFPSAIGNPSTGLCCRQTTCISVGALTPLFGSVALRP